MGTSTKKYTTTEKLKVIGKIYIYNIYLHICKILLDIVC